MDNRPQYDVDYEWGSELKKLADELEICDLVVTHTPKSDFDDPLNKVSGSTGFTGAVDSVLVLSRQHYKKSAKLFVTGRDIEETCFLLQFDQQIGSWSVEGEVKDGFEGGEGEIGSQLTSAEQLTLKTLGELGEVTTTEWERACEQAGVARATFYKAKAKLCAEGYIRKSSDNKGAKFGIGLYAVEASF